MRQFSLLWGECWECRTPLIYVVDALSDLLFAESTLQWLLRSEGVFIWPQAFLVLLTLTLVISAIDLTRHRVFMPGRVRRTLAQLLDQRAGCNEAAASISSRRSPLERVVSAGIQSLRRGEDLVAANEEVERACEDVAISTDRRTGWIAALAHVALMTGLLGTVCGLVASFMVISQKGEAPPPNELAEGVSQALSTTIVGLLTAIPAMLAHTYLRGAGDRVLYELEQASLAWIREFFHLGSESVTSLDKEVNDA